MLATIYIGIVLATISFVSIMVLVSSCIYNKSIASIVNILLILALSFSAYQAQHLLNQPEVYEGVSFEMDTETSPNIEITEFKVLRTLDRSALSRIFGNIISNAVKYSDGDFSVTLREDGKIVFSNTASELSSVAVGKLFDRFYTVDLARKSTGLNIIL